jgi:site-specific recombinase XerC
MEKNKVSALKSYLRLEEGANTSDNAVPFINRTGGPEKSRLRQVRLKFLKPRFSTAELVLIEAIIG